MRAPEPPPEWLTPAEAAAAWGITQDALRHRDARGTIPAGHVRRTPGGHRRYRAEYILRIAPRTEAA